MLGSMAPTRTSIPRPLRLLRPTCEAGSVQVTSASYTDARRQCRFGEQHRQLHRRHAGADGVGRSRPYLAAGRPDSDGDVHLLGSRRELRARRHYGGGRQLEQSRACRAQRLQPGHLHRDLYACCDRYRGRLGAGDVGELYRHRRQCRRGEQDVEFHRRHAGADGVVDRDFRPGNCRRQWRSQCRPCRDLHGQRKRSGQRQYERAARRRWRSTMAASASMSAAAGPAR